MTIYFPIWTTIIVVLSYFMATEPLFYRWLILRTLRVRQWLMYEWLKATKVKDPRVHFESIWEEATKNGNKYADEYFPRD